MDINSFWVSNLLLAEPVLKFRHCCVGGSDNSTSDVQLEFVGQKMRLRNRKKRAFLSFPM